MKVREELDLCGETSKKRYEMYEMFCDLPVIRT